MKAVWTVGLVSGTLSALVTLIATWLARSGAPMPDRPPVVLAEPTAATTAEVLAPAPDMPVAPVPLASAATTDPSPQVEANAWQVRRDPVEDPVSQEREFIERHESEPREESWARSAESSLWGGLAKVAEKVGFKVGTVECKTTTCLGAVEFASRAEGRRKFASVLHSRYSPNCAVAILLSDSPAGAPTPAKVRFECEASRIEDFDGN